MCEPRILVCDPNHMSDQRWRKQVSAILNSRLKPSASPVPAGRRIPIDTQADPALNEAIAEVRSRYRSLYGGRCRSQCVCVATVHIPLK